MTTEQVLAYEPAGDVLRAFHRSQAFVRGIRGPVGSGKSTACVVEILRRASAQAPGPDGRRRTRWAVIRNTYPELRTTTIKTWHSWVPPTFGRFAQESPIVHHVQTADLDMEVLFLALDVEADARKLLSLELTGAWINEAREVPRAMVDALTGRVGRFPAVRDGGCTWSGILLDTNPPDTEHWFYRLAEVDRPEGWEFFSQPSGLSPAAENIRNLPSFYYPRLAAGKDEDWLRVYVHGEYGFVVEGKPVYPMFRDSTHVAREPLDPVPGLPLLAGVDFGLTPAFVIGQQLVDGRWLLLDELVFDDAGIIRAAEAFTKFVYQRYGGDVHVTGWGDPAGTTRSQIDERTALDVLRANTPRHWRWRPAPSNAVSLRLEGVRGALSRLVDGRAGLLVSPTCTMLRKGFNGGYCYQALRSGSDTYHEAPSKNQYSHVHDALQYLLSGGGEGGVALGRARQRRPPGQELRVIDDWVPFS